MGDVSPPFEVGMAAALEGGHARAGRSLAGQDLFWIALAGSVAGFVLLVLKPNRERIREAEAECRLIRSEIAALESHVARLRRWERALASDDRDAWAAVARERLGWLSPGEKMVRRPASRDEAIDQNRSPASLGYNLAPPPAPPSQALQGGAGRADRPERSQSRL